MFGFRKKRGWETPLERLVRRLRLTLRILLFLLIADLIYVAGMWPDWGIYSEGPIFKSRFIKTYQHDRAQHGGPELRWRPIPLEKMSRHLLRSVIVAEDGRFYDHIGFDKVAFEEAMEYNVERRRFVYGASTISQQTIKNLLLSPSRNPLRKWHELLLTLGMELFLEKERILELYLNLAEFGPGIYGVEAASRAYWGIPASRLSRRQAAELAATLPAPKEHNPRTRTKFFRSRTRKLLQQMARV